MRTVTVSRTTADGRLRRLGQLLSRPRYEVLPLGGTFEQVEEHVPPTLPVTVTASPQRGLEPTLALAEALASGGFSAVPHLAARLVTDEVHLAEILSRLDEAGVSDVFVVAGDGETPAGGFAGATELLTAIERLRASGVGHGLRSLGVAGYPEGHPLICNDDLDRALLSKQSMASYVVTQMCFDAGAVDRWVGHARERGVRLPVHAGVAGAVDRLRLLRIAGRIGVGTSIRFLRRHRGGSSLLRTDGHRADELVERLGSDVVPEDRRVAGLHVYTLGDVGATERWRRELLDRLDDGGVEDG